MQREGGSKGNASVSTKTINPVLTSSTGYSLASKRPTDKQSTAMGKTGEVGKKRGEGTEVNTTFLRVSEVFIVVSCHTPTI